MREQKAEGVGSHAQRERVYSRQPKARLAHKGSKAAKQQRAKQQPEEEMRSRHTLKMGACVPANNNPGLLRFARHSCSSELPGDSDGSSFAVRFFASRSAGRWTAGLVRSRTGLNAME